MIKSKKITFIFIIVLITFTGSGCWDRRELETLGVVVGVGIDTDKKQNVILTNQVLNPSSLSSTAGGSNPGSEPVLLINSKGATIFDAIRNSTRTNSRRLYWPHNKVIVIGQGAAKRGLQPLLDFFSRDAETRPNVWLLVSKQDAAKIFQASGGIEKIPSEALAKILDDYGSSSEFFPVQIIDFNGFLLSETRAPVVPEIDIQESNGKKHFNMVGTAVFKRDKLIGELNPIETRGLLWVIGKVKSGIIVIRRNRKAIASLEILKANTHLKPLIDGDRITMNVTIKMTVQVGQISVAEELLTSKKLESLEELCNKEVKEEITRTVDTARKLNADIFGFGDVLNKCYPADYKVLATKWNTIFRQIDLNINVKSHLQYVGHTSRTLLPKFNH